MYTAPSEAPLVERTHARRRSHHAVDRGQWNFGLPRKRDRQLIEELKAEAARQDMSAAALCRWILRAVLHGQHPARVRARLIATRKSQPAATGEAE